MPKHPLHRIVESQGGALGAYSICSAHPHVIQAAMEQALLDESPVLIESTSNQVNQDGGYTGMRPTDFVRLVTDIGQSLSFPPERIILGGDHLGPLVWKKESAESAMEKARALIEAYVQAGYSKIHLDASMRLGDDSGDNDTPVDPKIIAERAADMCRVAEDTYQSTSYPTKPVYVIGAEVPIPGGALEELNETHITTVGDARQTIELTRQVFGERGLQEAWERVIALVVEPGVEFGDSSIIGYDRGKASDLSSFITDQQGMVYEAHSTDYQTLDALRQMVEDQFAILKVGPALTFAFREAVFALAEIEKEWLGHTGKTLSGVCETLDRVMIEHPKYWEEHYQGNLIEQQFARRFSFSDRSRYYWARPEVQQAVDKLLTNLIEHPIPLSLLSQYMPNQYRLVREGKLLANPLDLIHSKVMEVTADYSYACRTLKSE